MTYKTWTGVAQIQPLPPYCFPDNGLGITFQSDSISVCLCACVCMCVCVCVCVCPSSHSLLIGCSPLSCFPTLYSGFISTDMYSYLLSMFQSYFLTVNGQTCHTPATCRHYDPTTLWPNASRCGGTLLWGWCWLLGLCVWATVKPSPVGISSG